MMKKLSSEGKYISYSYDLIINIISVVYSGYIPTINGTIYRDAKKADIMTITKNVACRFIDKDLLS